MRLLPEGRWWVALVSFERSGVTTNILPDWALGAYGWMVALAPNEEAAGRLIRRDLEHHSLHVIEIQDEREVFSEGEIAEIDDHLASNFRAFEPGRSTAWGTLHCYSAGGEA